MSAEVAEQALREILRLVERSRVLGTKARTEFTVSTRPLAALVKRLDTQSQWNAFNAKLADAEHQGAVRTHWDPTMPRGVKLAAIEPASFDCLCRYLDHTPYEVDLARARRSLTGAEHPSVPLVLESWRQMKTYDGLKLSDLGKVIDALRVLEHCVAEPKEQAVRRLSCALFRDSKRIERISDAIHALHAPYRTDGDLGDRDETLLSLGLIRFPQPFLVCGPGQLRLRKGTPIPIPSPYLGVGPDAVAGVQNPGRYFLTVENLTTFNEFAAGVAGRLEGTVVFVPGRPGPKLREALKRTYAKLDHDVEIWHWGDQDLQGFQIAATLAELAGATGAQLLRPFKMQPDGEVSRHALPDQDIERINQLCASWGWSPLFGTEAVEQEAQFIEQP